MAYKKIRLIPNVFNNDVILQTYVQSNQIMFRVFKKTSLLSEEAKAKTQNTFEESELWTNNNLVYSSFLYENESYTCIYNKLVECPSHILNSYREVYACVNVNQNDVEEHDQLFFIDRLGETYFSKGKNMHWTAFIKSIGCQYIYRFILEPGKDLTNAAVICPIEFPLITNLEFDFTHEYYEDDLVVVEPLIQEHRPTVTIEGPDTIPPNGTAIYTLKVINADGSQNTANYTYLLDCKQGYAPSKEVKVVNGIGTFKIMALGLEEGESLRFKIDDQAWTSYAEKEASVRS